jgi:hypothetical protein
MLLVAAVAPGLPDAMAQQQSGKNRVNVEAKEQRKRIQEMCGQAENCAEGQEEKAKKPWWKVCEN